MTCKTICVYCSSSDAVHSSFFDVAAELGAALGERGCTLVYGGADVGLMGAVARAVRAKGGKVVGVIPGSIKVLADKDANEMVVARDMRERKAIMEKRSDAFVALPGGFGTLEELLEIITLKQLGYHAKPMVLLNANDFFAPLNDLFEHLYRHTFAKPAFRDFYHFAPAVKGVFEYLDAYKPPHVLRKWFRPE